MLAYTLCDMVNLLFLTVSFGPNISVYLLIASTVPRAFCSPFRCSYRFGRTQDKATTRQPGISVAGLVAWNSLQFVRHLRYQLFQKHAQDHRRRRRGAAGAIAPPRFQVGGRKYLSAPPGFEPQKYQ